MWKLRVGVEHYYLSQVARGLDDYYTGRGEAAGRWLGVASSGLGLERGDEVAVDALQAVLAGLRPGTGLTPNGTQLRTWRNRVPGFDLTFSAPKSVSALYALADPLVAGQVVEACDAAVEAALAWLEREACFVRRGSNNRAATPGTPSGEWGTRRLRGAGFVAAGFRHRTSRAGDPQLHTHVLVANITRGPDQRWTALDGQAIYRCKHAAGSVYQTVLRDELTRRLGVDWGPVHKGSAEIAGVPRRLLRLWSKRRNEIEAELEATGQSGPAAADAAALTTRPSKERTDIATLRERWLDEADTVGFGTDNIDQLLGHVNPPTDEHSIVDLDDSEDNRSGQTFITRVAAAMTQVDSTCTRHQITEVVAAAIPHGTSVAALERITNWVLAQPELVPITPTDDPHSRSAGWEQRWTTRSLLAMEHDLIATYTDPTRTAGLDPALVESHLATAGSLGSDQADAVRKIALHGRGVDVIVGRAGTGKTHTMNTIRQLFEHAGHTVIGAAPSARAARELADGAGIDASTFPRFRNHQRDQLGAGHVVVIDEAGMASTPDLHDLVTTARRAGAKVILVGDHHQLPEVNAGGGFATAVQIAGDHTAELIVNRRQIHEWEHHALAELRHGHVLAGFRAYVDHDRVVLHERTVDVHHAAVDAWLASHQAGHHAVLLAGTRNEARTLNRLARHNLADHLHGPILELDDRHFQAGDRIVLLRNSYGHTDLHTGRPCWVDNGMIATITHVHPTDQLDIECVNGRPLRLDADYTHAGHIDHGYATTIHKAQGLTCDEMMLVGPLGLYREAVYVAMSRARNGSTIFATSRQASELADQPHTTGIPLPSEHPDTLDHDLTTAVKTSRAKTFATTLAPHLTNINHLAHTTTLDHLQHRHLEIRTVARRLVAAGHTDPTEQTARLARARTTRLRLHVGGRVNAADWDNVGTVTAIFNRTGTALITFTSNDRTRTATKTLHWSDLTPIDHPDPAEPTVDTDHYFALATTDLDERTTRWHAELAAHGIAHDEPAIVAAASATRRQLVTHALAAQPPDWLIWWLGQRPTDPAGADIWDTELAHLATWRDTHHIPTATPGYGPSPNDPDDRDRWREHLDRSLTTRTWLADHTSDLPTPEAPPVDITAVRERLRELTALFASAPPDQTRIIADLASGRLASADIHHALTATAEIQHARRDWILEHWPHIVEHAELTRIDRNHDPLAHWPTPPDPTVQALLDQLRAISADTPEPRSLLELDAEINATNPHHHLAELAARQHACRGNIDALVASRTGAGPSSAALIDQHLQRLREQLAQLEAEWRTHDTAIALWDIGSRPRHLQDAVIRRANHLAHTAIGDHEPWLVAAIDAWSRTTSGDNISQLHTLITGIAAYRERHTIAGHDPIGSAPTDPSLLDAWRRLHEQFEVPHPRRPAGTTLIEPALR